MRSWLFIFGRTHEFSYSELAASVGGTITRISPEISQVEDAHEHIVPKELIKRLGGTVKIALVKGIVHTLSLEEILPYLQTNEKQLTFGISLYGNAVKVDASLLRGIKEALGAQGIGARYVSSREGNTLSSVVVAKQHVRELIIVGATGGYIVGETAAVQDFEEWGERDRGRPFADPKAGMLPPKVARMAVNIAGGGGTLLDPFCGMGTILAEALLAGWQVIGSDRSEEAAEKARKNLEWLTGGNPVKKQGSTLKRFQLIQSDATHISEHIPAQSVDAIVTEPYLGPETIEPRRIKDIIKGLEKLYIGCLRDWLRVLRSGGKIVIALPEYAIKGKTFVVKSVIDRCETLGYTVSLGPLPYSRPQAMVRRKFYQLLKK